MLLDVYRHKDIGYIPNLFWDCNFLRSCYINERPHPCDAAYTGKDWFGCEWVYEPDQDSSAPKVGTALVCTDVTKWREQVAFSDLDAFDWEHFMDEETAHFNREKKISMVMLEIGIFARIQNLLGFENALVSMYEEPEAFLESLDALTEHRLKIIDIVGPYYKPDVIMHHDNFNHQQSMMMSLGLWQEFFKPRLAKLVERCHSYGVFYEQHSCGYITPLVPEFIEIGVDALNDLQTRDDLDVIKRTYDQLASGGSYISMPIVLGCDNCTMPILLEHRKIVKHY